VGELEADVGVELALMDFVEHVVVELGALPGLVGVGDVLAQVVDADARAPLVDHLRGADRVADFMPATKRCEKRSPSGEFSAKLRKDLFSESPMKSDLNMRLQGPDRNGGRRR